MPDIHVAWWNVENLFDHERAVRDPKLARTLRGELKGWTAAVRDRKLDQLASIVMHMCEGKGPDLLGIGEVEHEGLLRMLIDRLDLPERSYQVSARGPRWRQCARSGAWRTGGRSRRRRYRRA